MVTTGSLGGLMVSTLSWNTRDVGSVPALGTIFHIVIALTTLIGMTIKLYKLRTVWLLKLPCVCIGRCLAYMYVIVSIKRFTIPGG